VVTAETKAITHITVDRSLCQTAATCLGYQMYELDDEGIAVLLTKNGGNSDDPTNPEAPDSIVAVSDLLNPHLLEHEQLQALALASAKICPFNAIIVTNADGKQIWPPEIV
jgi:ferredoxin